MNKARKWSMVALVGAGLAGCVSGDMSLAQLKANGNAQFARGHYDKALDQYQRYLERRPDSVEMRQKVARTLAQLGRPSEAVGYMQTVYDVDPTLLANATALAQARVDAGDIAGGLGFLRQYLESHPTARGYFDLADLASKAGLPDDALRALKIAEKIEGTSNPETHRRLARFFEAHDRVEDATRQWRMVLWFDDSDPEASAALRALGQVPGPSFAIHPTE